MIEINHGLFDISVQASIRRELNEFKSQEMEVILSYRFEQTNIGCELAGA